MTKSARQQTTPKFSGKGSKDIDKLLSDPRAMREACALIREAIVVRARADDLRVREQKLMKIVPDQELGGFLRDALELKAQADTLAAREKALVGNIASAGVRKRCTKANQALHQAAS